MNHNYEQYMMQIPIVPEVATKIMQLNESNDIFSSSDLTRLISMDPYLSASILKIANSALYSRRTEIRELDTAVNLIGFRKIKTMVLLLAGASLFKKNNNSRFYQIFWRHSIISAFICRDISEIVDKNRNSDEYFTAALLHRIGEVPLYLSNKERYLKLIDDIGSTDRSLSDYELEVFDVDYCRIGSELLSFWDFPQDLIKAAGCSVDCPVNTDLLVDTVRLSDMITIKQGFGINEFIDGEMLDSLLSAVNLSRDDYDYFTSEAYYETLKNSAFFRECQSTLDVDFTSFEQETRS